MTSLGKETGPDTLRVPAHTLRARALQSPHVGRTLGLCGEGVQGTGGGVEGPVRRFKGRSAPLGGKDTGGAFGREISRPGGRTQQGGDHEQGGDHAPTTRTAEAG